MKKSKIYTLQDIYLCTRSNLILDLLYKEILILAEKIVYKKQHKMPFQKQKERAESAAIRFLQMYLNHKNWSCYNFPVRLGLDVTYVLYRKEQRNIDNMYQLNYNLTAPEPVSKENLDSVLEDIQADSIHWKKIFLLCYKARSYKKFILDLSEIESKRFIYDHAARLHKIYKRLR